MSWRRLNSHQSQTGHDVSVVSINQLCQLAAIINLEMTSSVTAAQLDFLLLVPEAPPGTILKVALVGSTLPISTQEPQLSNGVTEGSSASPQKGS